MKLSARPRHPVTGKRITIAARTPNELATYLHRIESLRTELRLGMTSPEQADAQLRHMQHGAVSLERIYRAYVERPDIGPETRRAMASWWETNGAELAGPFAALDGPRVRRWLELLARRGMAASSIRTAWHKLSALGAYASARGWIAGVPWGTFKPPKIGGPGRPPKDATRSVDELVALLEAAKSVDRGVVGDTPGLAAKMHVALLFGLRQGELAGLRWTDIEWKPRFVLHVRRQWERSPLKNNTPARVLEGLPEARVALNLHMLEQMHRGLYKPNGPVFPHPKSERGAPRAYSRGAVLTTEDVRAVVDRASLPRAADGGTWSAHALRGSFVTLEAWASGGDLRRVQSRSGHASLTSLVRYLRMLQRSAPSAPLLRLPTSGGAEGAPLLPPPKKRHPALPVKASG